MSMFKRTINNVTYKTRSQLKSTPTGFSVYKTVFSISNVNFVYYGKQSFTVRPDMSYIGSGRRVQEKLAEMTDNDTITKIVLQNFESEQEAYDFESECIQQARKSNVNLLNLSKGNSGGKVFQSMTAEQIKVRNKKISQSMMGHTVSDATRKAISLARTGKKHSPDACQKISEANKGRVFGARSAETIEKMKLAQQQRRIREAA